MQETANAVKEVAATVRIPRDHEELRLCPSGLALSVLSGSDVVATRRVEGRSIMVGRSPLCDVTLDDASVSEFHLRLTVGDSHVAVDDMGSSNGLWIGRAKISRAELLPGARFKAGNVRLQLVEIEHAKHAVTMREEFHGLYGASEHTRGLFSLLARVAPTPLSTLVTGETGVGKGAVARAIHQASGRPGPLVVVDCTTLPRDLAESELFGHVKGAFTGASAARRSRFEEAGQGTVFLDEIGELPLDLQPKLLRVVDEQVVRRVGDTKERPVDVRIVAATNRHLPEEVSEGRFRADLYHRLSGWVIRVPPLRDRRDDIPILAEMFLKKISEGLGRPLTFSDASLESLMRRHWEGNVRQLLRTVERAGYLCQDSVVEVGDIAELDAALSQSSPIGSLKEAENQARRDYLLRLLPTCSTIDEAAAHAGTSSRTLYYAAARVGIVPRDLLGPSSSG